MQTNKMSPRNWFGLIACIAMLGADPAANAGTPVTINWSNPAQITYGTALGSSQLNATATVGATAVPGTFAYTPAAGTVLDAGPNQTLAVTFTPTDTATYDVTPGSVSLNVVKANITATANSVSRNYGAANPTFTGTVTGIVNNDPITYTFTCEAVPASLIGNYTLSVSLVDPQNRLGNYVVFQSDAILTVSKAPLTVTPTTVTPYYGDAIPTLTGTLAGLLPSDNITATYTTAAVQGNPVGDYPINVSLVDPGSRLPNYNVTFVSGFVKITKRPVYFYADDQTRTYGQPNATFTGSISGLLPADVGVVSASYSSAGTIASNPGNYTIVPAPEDQLNILANYAVYIVSGWLTINKAPQTITWATPADITYGTTLSASQLNASVAVIGPAVAGALTYNPSVGTLLNAGAQTLSVTAAATVQYQQATATVNLNVNKGTQTITWANPADIVYGTPLSSVQLNATVAGVTGGSAPGALTFVPAIGSVLDAGTHALKVAAVATANYNQASQTVYLVVSKATPVLANLSSPTITYGQTGITLGGKISFIGSDNNTYIPSGSITIAITGTNNLTAPIASDGTFTLPVTTDILPVASSGAPISYQYLGDGNFNAVSGGGSLTINKANQTITWANPADIVYGTPLTSVQLNATVVGVSGGSAPSALTYSPAANTLLNVGSGQTLSVTAVATSDYNEATKTVQINVLKLTPTVVWTPRTLIVYGTKLTATDDLNAVVTAPTGGSALGAITYNYTAGTMLDAGSYNLTLNVAATDNYNAIALTSGLTVAKAVPQITWANPAAITYGTPLSSAQLNAVVTGVTGGSDVGAVTYSPVPGAILGAGNQTLTVNVAASANYYATFQSVSILVNKGTPNLSALASPTITYGQTSITLSGKIGFTASDSTPYVPSGPVTVALVAAGINIQVTPGVDGTFSSTVTIPVVDVANSPAAIVYSHAGDANFNAITGNGVLTINKADQTITWANPADITYGTALSASQLNATVTVPSGGTAAGALTYAPAVPTILDAGASQALKVDVAATPNYNAASKTVSINVLKADQTITWAALAPITYGTKLGAAQFNATVSVPGPSAAGALSYNYADQALLGANSYNVTVTAAATANYNVASVTQVLVVNKANQIITWSTPADITYGTPLSVAQLNATVAGVTGGSAVGGLTYSPAAGEVLNAGPGQTLTVVAIATADYNSASASVPINVLKATPIFANLKNPVVAYGTVVYPLGGLITYTNALGTVFFPTGAIGIDFAGTNTPVTIAPDGKFSVEITTPVFDVAISPLPIDYVYLGDANFTAISSTIDEAVINKAEPVITWANPAEITYGTALSSAQLNATAVPVSSTLNYVPVTGTILNAGSQTLTVSIPATANYNAASKTVPLTVQKAVLTVTPFSATREYGDNNPAFTGTYTGFVLGEGVGAITTLPTFSSTATPPSPRGNYPIVGSGGVANNYSFSYATGTLQVTRALLTLVGDNKSRVYYTANPTVFTGSVSGFKNTDDQAVTISYLTEAVLNSPVGLYSIVPNLTGDQNILDNYLIHITVGVLTVTSAPLTVTANNASRLRLAPNPAFTVTYSGFVGGQNSSIVVTPPTVTTTADINSLEGTYPITPVVHTGSIPNYDVVNVVNGVLTVNNQSPTAQLFSAQRVESMTLKILASKVLATATDPENDTVTLASAGPTSANGATIMIAGDWIVYSAPSGFNSTDSFNYTISDGHGGTASSTISVMVTAATAVNTEESKNIVGKISQADGSMLIQFIGIPGRAYRVQATPNLIAPPTPVWTTLTTLTAGANGMFEYQDPAPLPPSRYYRAIP